MPRSDGRIEPGQRLKSAISARAWNRAQQAADIVLGSSTGLSAETIAGTSSPYVWVYAKNVSGTTASRWSVLAVTGVEITPTASLDAAATRQFESMPVLTADTLTGNAKKQTCVTVEPIADGKVGRVAVAGVVQARTEDVDKIVDGVVIWSNTDWALVRFGGGEVLHLCKTTDAFDKGTLATLDIWEDCDPPAEAQSINRTLEDVVNKYADIPADRFVSVARHGNGYWYVVAAECG